MSTGAFEQMPAVCRVCGRSRGWAYVLGAYGVDSLRDTVCPWCISDGSAARDFGVRFTEVIDPPSDVPTAVVTEIETRTPGFSAWQPERWLFHCGDGAAFLGAVGWEELEAYPDALGCVTTQINGWGLDHEDASALVGSLDVDGSATAYLFRCLHCSTYLAYADLE